MSLDYSYKRVKNAEEVMFDPEPGPDGDTMKAAVKAVIFRSMNVELGEITDDNVADWYARSAICDKVIGHMLFEGPKGKRIPLETFQSLIGLQMNVASQPDSVFLKNMTRHLKEKLAEAKRNATRQLEQETF